MAERHAVADRQQPGLRRGVRGRRPDAEPFSRAPEQGRIPERFCSRNQREPRRVVGQRVELTEEAVLDPASDCMRGADPEPTGELSGGQPSR